MENSEFPAFFDVDGLDLGDLSAMYETPHPAHADVQDPKQAELQHMFHDAVQGSSNSSHGVQSVQFPNTTQLPENDLFNFEMPMAFDHGQNASFGASMASALIPSHNAVPPTPNSAEMHPNQQQYFQLAAAQNRALLEQQFQIKNVNGGVTFSPLASPAPTPLDNHYSLQIDPLLGPFFSPLTSPALEGQTNYVAGIVSSSTTPTSVDQDPEQNENQPRQPKRPRNANPKKIAAPRSAVDPARARAPQTSKGRTPRKGSLATTSAVKPVGKRRNQTPKAPPALPTTAQGHSGSATDSVSPEPVTESIMGPPPKPSSTHCSPNIAAQIKSTQAATPASLMRISPNKPTPISTNLTPRSAPTFDRSLKSPQSANRSFDELVLPESATGLEIANRSPIVQPKPRTVGSTPLQLPKGTTSPTSPLANSATRSPEETLKSPATTGMNTPTIDSASKKGHGRVRATKKRGSVTSSTLPSPMLMPKISPNLKPLLRDGEDQHAKLLADRSNYHILVEGTKVPGVVYHSDITTNLTSKRTSHKIAEQGRRNRINLALQEMHNLLPKDHQGSPTIPGKESQSDLDDDEAGSSGKRGGSLGKGAGNSKAATVENAIEYIKILQREVKESEQLVKNKDRECDELRKQLKMMKARFTKRDEDEFEETIEPDTDK